MSALSAREAAPQNARPGARISSPMTSSVGTLVALTVLAALFRLSTLSVQHYWIDEAVTVGLLHLDLGQMLRTIPATESTPPLYYILAWGWTRLFGTGTFALRSLSAFAGIAAVPVCFAAAREFGSRTAALLATALAAVSPVLVWYSQEARAYSLLILLAALSLLFFGRAMRAPTKLTLALWSVTCVLALTTHYFAGFLVLGEAIWLVARGRTRVAAAVACAPIVLAAGALAPLALHQRQEGHLHFIAATSLDSRLSNAAEVFAAGQTGTRVAYVPLIGVGLAAVGLALLMQASVAEHRRLVPLAIVSLSAIALPVILAFVGQDYVLARNLLPVWPALVILVAAGLAATRSRRLGMLIAAALLCFSVCFCIAVPLTPKLRREAINAQLSYVPGENAAVEIAYVPLAAGQTRSSTVDCPGGYRPRAGEVHTVGEPGGAEGLGTVRTRRLAAGWAAIVLNSSPHRATYQLTVVCLPSREVG